MPIAIFIRTRPLTYFYHIILPKGKNSKVIYDYLEKNAKKVQKGHARRIEKPLSVQELKAIWPDAPFWRIKEDE
jgi:hypothetical protein